MRRSPMPARRTPLRSVARPSRPRNTGPSKAVLKKLHARDFYCAICGVLTSDGLQVHHRVNRGMGGRSAAWVSRPSNLLRICWEHNLDMEQNPAYAEKARGWGWKVRDGVDPRLVRVLHHRHGYVFLLDDGSVTANPHTARAAVAAADRAASA